MTASTAYRLVKTVSEVSTDPVPTVGETLSAVRRWPNTVQGCRPISVKIQPNELASSGSDTDQTAARQNQRPDGSRPARVSHRPRAASSTENMPGPIISRNDQ